MSTISSISDSNLLEFKIQKLEGINKRHEDDLEQKEKELEQKEKTIELQNFALEQKEKALEQKDSELFQQKQQNIQQQKDFAKILSSMGLSAKQIADKLNVSEEIAKRLIE